VLSLSKDLLRLAVFRFNIRALVSAVTLVFILLIFFTSKKGLVLGTDSFAGYDGTIYITVFSALNYEFIPSVLSPEVPQAPECLFKINFKLL